MTKYFLIAIAAAVVGTGPARAELADAIEAIVHDAVITYHEVNAVNEDTYASLVRRYRNQPELLEREMDKVRNKALEELMDRQLILHEFSTAGYSLPDSVINDLVEESVKNDFGDRATMAKTLEQTGVTPEQYRKRIRDRFVVAQLRLKYVPKEPIISPHKIEAYYLAHKDEFKVEDEAKLRVIVLTNATAPEKLAEEILIKIKGGASFADMATLYSQGSQSRQGGDWGWWEKTQLTKGLSDIAFSLAPGKCSGVFSRSAGDDYWVLEYEQSRPVLARHYTMDPVSKKQVMAEERRCVDEASCGSLPPQTEFYLLRLEDRHTAHVKPLNEVRDAIETNLKIEEHNRLNQQWIDKLKRKTFVKRFS